MTLDEILEKNLKPYLSPEEWALFLKELKGPGRQHVTRERAEKMKKYPGECIDNLLRWDRTKNGTDFWHAICCRLNGQNPPIFKHVSIFELLEGLI